MSSKHYINSQQYFEDYPDEDYQYYSICPFLSAEKVDFALEDERPESVAPEQHLPDYLYRWNRLKSLRYMRFYLSHIDRRIKHFTFLEELDLSENRIEYIPPEIGALSHLNRLDLSRNRINELPPDFFKLRQLRFLYLSHNNLSVIPEAFTALQELRVLYLDGNPIPRLPESLLSLKKLRFLCVSQSTYLPVAFFDKIKTLEILP